MAANKISSSTCNKHHVIRNYNCSKLRTVDLNEVSVFVADDNIDFSLITSFANHPAVTGRLDYQLTIIRTTHATPHSNVPCTAY